MNGVFLDTVGLLALWSVADQWHADAEAASRRIMAI
jgi:predicted nucleic acid-binding protein